MPSGAAVAADDVALQRRTTINYPLPTWPRPLQELNMTGRWRRWRRCWGRWEWRWWWWETEVRATYLRTSAHIAGNLPPAAICRLPRPRFLQGEEKRGRQGINITYIAALKVKLLIKSLCELFCAWQTAIRFAWKAIFVVTGKQLETRFKSRSGHRVQLQKKDRERERGEGEKEESWLCSGHLMDYVVNCPNDVDIGKIMFTPTLTAF